MIKKVGIIGHFGFGENLLNGQTIKTITVSSALEEEIGTDEIIKVDTHGGIKFLFKLPFQVLRLLKNTKNIVIFPAYRGLRIITPLLIFFNKFHHRKLHYCVIGGWLNSICQERKRLAKKLKIFDYIYVETSAMKMALEQQGFENVIVMPNFKDLTILDKPDVHNREYFKLCTFSRVMKQKGIEDAVDAVKKVNDEAGKIVFELDIYGQIDSNQVEWFEKIKANLPGFINYRGMVSFDKTVEVLKSYDLLLFPTYYDGEGFAGTLLDAMSAGVPVIASDWKFNSEIVDERNGWLFETKNVDDLIDKMKAAVKIDLTDKKKSSLEKAREYSKKTVAKILIDNLD